MRFNPSRNVHCANAAASRRGMVLVAVVVVFAIALALFGVWTKSALREQQRIRNQQFRLQAVRLAEAGVRRAVARRAGQSQYEGETWHVSAEMLDKSHDANVQIRVVRGNETATLI